MCRLPNGARAMSGEYDAPLPCTMVLHSPARHVARLQGRKQGVQSMKLGCLTVAALLVWLVAPAIDGAIRALGAGLGDAARILAAGAAVALVLLAGGAVWALKPQSPRPVVLFDNRTVVLVSEPQRLALDAEWVEVDA
jgi:hypothetical protein